MRVAATFRILAAEENCFYRTRGDICSFLAGRHGSLAVILRGAEG